MGIQSGRTTEHALKRLLYDALFRRIPVTRVEADERMKLTRTHGALVRRCADHILPCGNAISIETKPYTQFSLNN